MLYIVGTPIGNLQDLSIRQAQTLLSSEYILSEDTRSTGILFQKMQELFPHIAHEKKPVFISYYKDTEFEKLPEVMELIRDGHEISLTSQAGMPLVSDPGFLLVSHVIKEGLPFTVVPGPTAIATALVYSGLNPQHHMFLGFLPKKPNDLKKLLDKMMKIREMADETIFVAYESPNRINKTLLAMAERMPTAQVVIARELTKKFEEVVRGTPSDLAPRTYKGELTLVIKPGKT